MRNHMNQTGGRLQSRLWEGLRIYIKHSVWRERILSMDELIQINYENAEKPTVSGRELHQALEIKTAYKDWFPRMCEYGFTEGTDFNPLIFEQVRKEGTREVVREMTDHALTIQMAKELCMIQRTEIGRKFRQYFIQIEQAWNSPEMVMQRALKMADAQLARMTQQVKVLEIQTSELTVANQVMKPKADYFDEMVDRNLLTGLRETAKELHIGQKVFINFLLANHYLYRTQNGKLKPYAQHIKDGLFELKECINEKSSWKGTQVLVTPKGRETFRMLCI